MVTPKKPRKAAAKKAPATGRTTPKAPTPKAPILKPSRLATFDSASDEWKGEPIGFRIDGRLWLCDGSPNSKVIRWLRDPSAASVIGFLNECVQDKEEWAEYLDETGLPSEMLVECARFLMRAYLGLDPGK